MAEHGLRNLCTGFFIFNNIFESKLMNNETPGKKKIPVVIMAGGLGKRARSIDSSLPKPLIPIAGKPILLWEIECLVSQGYTDIILTVSYLAEKIEEFFGDGSAVGCRIEYFNESTPLGNAGALYKLWESHRLDGDFLLLNADSMFDIDFDRFYNFHRESGALATLFVHPNNHPVDSGLIVIDSDGWVEQWLTKEDPRPEWYKNCVNAGIHVLNSAIFTEPGIGVEDPSTIGTEVDGKIVKVDLDRQILKPLAGKQHKLYSVSSPEYVKDMGTPERFEQVQRDLESGLVASRNLARPQKAIFLDRDGTINKYVGFLRSVEQLELIEGAAEAIKLINSSGYLAIVITNQPVIARGEVTVSTLDLIHSKMETLLGQEGAYLDAIYYCPHHPDKGFEGEVVELKIPCDCRKPKPGLILRACKDFNIDASQSYMIGDSHRDIICGRNAGCKTVLLTSPGTEGGAEAVADHTAPDLLNAVKMILK